MTEYRTKITHDSEWGEVLSRWFKEVDASSTETRKWNYGRYDLQNLAQDQVIIRIGRGSKIDTYRGLHIGTDEDSQSDYTDATSARLIHNDINFLNLLIQDFEKKLKSPWAVWKCFVDEDSANSVAVEGQVGDQAVETTTDDVLQLTSEQLASAILYPEAEADMPRLREMILIAEDTGFTIEQSKQLSPWLLSFAERYRDSDDPQDEATVLSAIRTGASMLTPDDTDGLLTLLEPGHSIETSLVTVKMLGRIFEAQPPTEVDEYKELANDVYQIAKSLLNRYAITVSQSAAMAQLAIYTLASMASSKTQQIVDNVKELGVTWFTQQTLRELCGLRSIWSSRPVPVKDRPQELLDRVIKILE